VHTFRPANEQSRRSAARNQDNTETMAQVGFYSKSHDLVHGIRVRNWGVSDQYGNRSPPCRSELVAATSCRNGNWDLTPWRHLGSAADPRAARGQTPDGGSATSAVVHNVAVTRGRGSFR
jgi:hypothetical protein